MVAEDPSFHVEVDQESSETILKGMGELHLDIKVDILRRTHGVDVNVGKPQVAYRETITRSSTTPTRTRSRPAVPVSTRRSSTRSSRGEPGSGFVFESAIVGGSVPKEFIPAVEKGFKVSVEKGLLAGYPLVDVKVDADRRRLPRRRLVGSPSRSRPRRPSARRCPRPVRSCSSRS